MWIQSDNLRCDLSKLVMYKIDNFTIELFFSGLPNSIEIVFKDNSERDAAIKELDTYLKVNSI